jgi:mannose-1-phosphate guanylyltransferase/mannose-6-phosphate isomerase
MTDAVVIPVILCGGSGMRLWPVSRECRPKQFLNLTGDASLLQETIRRAMRVSGADPRRIVTVTLEKFKSEVKRHLAEVDPGATEHILYEPAARNTAAAVTFAALYIKEMFGENAVMWVLPADHHIGDESALHHAFGEGLAAASHARLVTFGIRPSRPGTGYGYIRLGDSSGNGSVYKADAFIEKPDAETARSYMNSGSYLWNSGMFMFQAKTVLTELTAHAPFLAEGLMQSLSASGRPGILLATCYTALPEIPFDRAVMEKSDNVVTIPCDLSWSDVGSWESVWDIYEKDANGNAIEGRVACHDTRDCLIISKNRLVAVAGVENIVVIETNDAILIAPRDNTEAAKALISGLKKSGSREISSHVNTDTDAGKEARPSDHYYPKRGSVA